MSVDETLIQQVDAWLQPVEGGERTSGTEPSDDVLRACREALAGKADSQFAEAVPPDFRQTVSLAQKGLADGRDLRLAVPWVRGMLRTRGVHALSEGLRLVHGLLAQFPADLYPLPDPEDGAQYARANALADLASPNGLVGDLRQTVLATDRVQGDIRVRTIEIATSRLAARQGEPTLTPEQVQQFFASHAEMPALRSSLLQAQEQIRQLTALMGTQFGGDDDVPDFKPVAAMLQMVIGVLPPAPQPEADAPPEGGDAVVEGTPSPAGRAAAPPQGLSGQIQSRADLVRAIDMASSYLERAEPSNPARLFLQRARQLLDHDFLQLIQELAPGALADVARVVGVDPAKITPPSNSG